MTWVKRRIEHLADEARKTLDPAQLGSIEVDHYSIPALDATGEPSVEQAADIQSHKQVLRGGELLVSRLNPRKARVVAVPPLSFRPALCSGEFIVLRPKRVDPRYLEYLLLSERTRQTLDGAVQSVTRSHQRIRPDQLLKMVVEVPESPTQRAIADFLDTETARIDALITKKRRMIEVLEQRMWSAVTEAITSLNAPQAPLRRAITRITDGPFGTALTSNHYTDEGARVIRLGNVGRGEFRDEDQAFISMGHYAALSRHSVRAGDLIIAGLGDTRNHVGRACVAPDLGPTIVKADCYCAEVDRQRATPEFLALYLSSPLGAKGVAVTARGTTRSRINLDIAKDVPVPLPSLGTQKQVVWQACGMRSDTATLTDRLTRQISLLQEHRQALITAAVTGELDVSGVAV